jgi:multiple sugar transport system permease protein
VLSFVRWDVITRPFWEGFANWKNLFTGDPLFWQALKVTAIYSAGSVPSCLLLAFVLALLLNNPWKGTMPFRTIYYIPMVISGVPMCIVWVWIFHRDFGLLNYFLGLVGITGPEWLSNRFWVLPSLILMSMWHVGGTMVIFLAGLQGVPQDLYEAASLDGAGWRARIMRITLPMISPVILFNLVTGVIDSFRTFTQGLVMTNGGPGNASLFYVLYLYRTAFSYFRMGYGAALAWFLFMVIAALTLLLFRTVGRSVYYAGFAGR